MRKFEIHITGDVSILEELDYVGMETMTVNRLQPNGEHFVTEHMSVFTSYHNTYEECKLLLEGVLNNINSEIYRLKINSKLYQDYIERSLYMDAFFFLKEDPIYPIFQDENSKQKLQVSRCFNKVDYDKFAVAWDKEEIQLCLYDDAIRQDFEWFKLYGL